MQPVANVESMISGYVLSTIRALGALRECNLHGHMLIVLYSAIDTFALLGAPANQVETTGQTFRDWLNKYMLVNARGKYTAEDLWGARCAVLHTFTSESNWSRQGKARELQYIGGDRESEAARQFANLVPTLEGGRYAPVHLDDLLEDYFDAAKKFAPELVVKCVTEPESLARLRKVFQYHLISPETSKHQP